MSALNSSYKYHAKNFIELKESLNCFNWFKSRILESIVLHYDNISFFDFGYKYITTKKISLQINNIYISNVKQHPKCLHFFFFDFVTTKHSTIRYNRLFLIKKSFEHSCFVIGRFLNVLHNGYSIGILGFVGFVFKKSLVDINGRITSMFIINKIDFLSKKIYISQKSIRKLVYRTLFKLSSLLVYVTNN